MDERREGTDLPVNGDGMAVKPAVSPYGRHVWIGAVLGILSFIGAVWTVIDRWLNRILRAPIDLFQHMTTAEPHPQMLELTVCAFKAALGELEETAE